MTYKFPFLIVLLLNILISCSKDSDPINPATDCEDADFSMSTTKWRMYSIYDDYKLPATGVYEQSSGGLRAFSLSLRGGSMILTNKEFDLAGKTVYFKWKANGQNDFSGICTFISNECYDDPFATHTQLAFLSTGFSWEQYVKINENAEYYTRVQFTASSAKSITAANNYDDQGGSIIQDITISDVNPIGRFGIYIGDTYSIGASITLIECKIR